jgi:sugar phosphate isomerase/epimerase
MKIGMITDSLGGLDFAGLIRSAGELGIEMLEFSAGNWSPAPHLKLDALLESAVTRKTIKLASLIGVERVVMMSGCPGGKGDANANWVTTSWPAEMQTILAYQWDEVLIPYWRDLAAYANGLGIKKLCLELHGHQNVYNVETFQRLRDAVGDTVGVNFDPSHLLWMGADPLAAIRALGDAIYHVHAKDTHVDPTICGINGRLETKPSDAPRDRAWNYVTLGYGHGETWWRQFCAALKLAGYNDVLSIEHEDMAMSPLEGVTKSVRLLREAMIDAAPPRRV